ncbi:hypothetical protein [Archaeoglobus profundus]|uniref:Uncharacterized protein n=1 Tax=Archaeoglobus profundus (strain DSM 5631 / JCM 9629 / NBRC 100127 / Av18) TaxID=572546 RepID=D2RFW4_ARCPA|nr:hypothetical protein [Archaeoglobus profundus]ADB57189.1 hypothetical protein Arcpr_0117 [Archaeoglobus profundus DSM 5631]
MVEEEREEIIEGEEALSGSFIRLVIKGDDNGMGFELTVKADDDLKKVEKVFMRVFERVSGLINGQREKGIDVV